MVAMLDFDPVGFPYIDSLECYQLIRQDRDKHVRNDLQYT